jgi:hypothetical protein
MKSIFIISALAFSWCLGAAVPTVEGLFRNGANADIQGDTIALSLIIENIDEESEDLPLYMKVIFSNRENEPQRMIQVLYTEAAMENHQVSDVYLSGNISDQIRLDSPVERKLLFGLLMKYGLNSSLGMNHVITRVSPDYKTNKELISDEKLLLYRKYMQFLRETERSQRNAEGVENPMRPTDPEVRERVREVLAENFFRDAGAVQLKREKGRFYWEVSLDNFNAMFTNDRHRLRRLGLRSIDGVLELSIGEYVMFNGVHDLPKTMLWSLPNGNRYRLTFTAHQDFVSRNRTIQQRHQEYERAREAAARRNLPPISQIRSIFAY